MLWQSQSHSSPHHNFSIDSPLSLSSNSHLLPGEMTSFASLPCTNPSCSLGSPRQSQTALIINEKYQNHPLFFSYCLKLLPRRPDFSSEVYLVCRTKMILGGTKHLEPPLAQKAAAAQHEMVVGGVTSMCKHSLIQSLSTKRGESHRWH